MSTPTGSGVLAKDLLEYLARTGTEDPADVLPAVDKLTTADLTTGVVGGTGVFDALMVSLSAHVKKEYEAGRITGAEYTRAYVGVVEAALATATQFLLGRDQAYWQNLLTKRQAGVADATHALTVLKLATEDATYDNLLTQGEILGAQKLGVEHDNTGKVFTNTEILPLQRTLLSEQVEVQRAQTADERSDTFPVSGLIGKQKALYEQQITSYKRDAETKVAKLFTDAWITQKTIDEGLLAPNQFQNTSINTLLTSLRDNLSL